MPEVPVAVDIGNQLQEDHTGHNDQDEAWNDRNGGVIQDVADRNPQLQRNDSKATCDRQELIPEPKGCCIAPRQRWTDALLGARLSNLKKEKEKKRLHLSALI